MCLCIANTAILRRVDFALRGPSKRAGLLAETRSCNGRKSSTDWRIIYGSLHHSVMHFKETFSYRPVGPFGGRCDETGRVTTGERRRGGHSGRSHPEIHTLDTL
jgi:hypothetical protein